MLETRLDAHLADGFQNTNCSSTGDVGCVLRSVEAHANMALSSEIVDFVRLDPAKQAREAGSVAQVSVVQMELSIREVRIAIDIVEAGRVERRGPANDSVDFVSFLQQEFGKIGAVLSGNSSNQCFFAHGQVL